MRWIRLHNLGDFDVVTAISMIGASVKVNEDPIGLYGSGVKFAMAQCIREGYSLKISDRGKLYTLASKSKEFRREQFNMICLKTQTGKMHETGITSDFGKEDWTDPWFVFREFYSNMLDEYGQMDVVDGIQCHSEGVDVFLPYHVFQEYADNVDDYFVQKNWSVRVGSGRIFKRGVYVGTFDENPGVDLQSNVEITESRIVKLDSAWTHLTERIEYCKCPDCWTAFLSAGPSVHEKMSVYFGYSQDSEQGVAFDAGLRNVFGENYVLCPNHEQMIKDCEQVYDRTPVVLPEKWSLAAWVPDIRKIVEDIQYREPTAEEQGIIDSILAKISDFIDPMTEKRMSFRVSIDLEGAGGNVDRETGRIALKESLFQKKNRMLLMQVMIHEINHLKTNAGDYDRWFAKGYETYLAKLFD